MENEFKTDTQYVEKIYERIKAFNHEETTRDTIKRSTNILQAGERFLKYGRMGKPHMRFVQVSEKEDFIYWYEYDNSSPPVDHKGQMQYRLHDIPSENRDNGDSWFKFTKNKIKFIRIEDIVDIKVGYNASAVLKRHGLPIEFDDLIFSI
jgi:hypothetical protein